MKQKRINKKKDWLVLTYVIPWAIGGVFAIPLAIMYFVFHINSFESLSYSWILNVAIILILLKGKLMDWGWLEELREANIINKIK